MEIINGCINDPRIVNNPSWYTNTNTTFYTDIFKKDVTKISYSPAQGENYTKVTKYTASGFFGVLLTAGCKLCYACKATDKSNANTASEPEV